MNSPKNETVAGRTWLLKAFLSLKSTIQHTQRSSLAVSKHLAKSKFAHSQSLIHQLGIQSITG